MKDAKKILAAMRKKRGYLLSYHRLLGAADPELLAAYDAFYSRLTLAARVLSDVEKETIWIALIVATRAKVGTLHFERARKAGMSREAIADAVAIGAACEVFDAMDFSAAQFRKYFSKNPYLEFFKSTRLVHIAAAVAQAGRRRPEAMALHLERAFRAGATRAQVAEGLLYCLLHCGGPTMLEAVDCWERTARRKRIPAPY
jgi:alkylhydroperoxidase/carboxymuconolactone decarboxylase family protein YurZ